MIYNMEFKGSAVKKMYMLPVSVPAMYLCKFLILTVMFLVAIVLQNLALAQIGMTDLPDGAFEKFTQIHGRDADGKHIHLLYGTSLKFHVVDHAGSNHDTEQIQHHNHAVELGQQDIHLGQRQIQKCVFPHNEIDKCVGGSQDTNGQQHGNHAGSLFFPKFDCQRFHNFGTAESRCGRCSGTGRAD